MIDVNLSFIYAYIEVLHYSYYFPYAYAQNFFVEPFRHLEEVNVTVLLSLMLTHYLDPIP